MFHKFFLHYLSLNVSLSLRYITFADMSCMLSTSDKKRDSKVLKMWCDGLQEIRCKASDKIMYEEFKEFLKGQVPKEAGDTSRRLSSSQILLMKNFRLQSVPEGVAKSQISRDSFGNIISFGSLKPTDRSLFSTRATSIVLPITGSMLEDGDDVYDLPSTQNRTEPIRKDDVTYLESEVLGKRQEFRMSVLHAAKQFDQKQLARLPIKSSHPAGLIIFAGSHRPVGNGVEENELNSKLATASKRSGRYRMNKKTKSDLSLLVEVKDMIP